MRVSDLLHDIRLGNSVAEADGRLDKYFIDTHVFKALTDGLCDIIAGDKGTGKTALYRILVRRQKSIEQLKKTRIITAFNPTGSPIFKEFLSIPQQSEGQYIAFWKTYFLSLAGNWMAEDSSVPSAARRRMQYFLETTGLKTIDTSPMGIFSGIIALFPKKSVKAFELDMSLGEGGLPHLKPKMEFSDSDALAPNQFFGVDYPVGLKLLDSYLRDAGIIFWITLDRLDEAFQGFVNIEVPALRALLRTYLDLQDLSNVKLKLFLRKDLFRRIVTSGGNNAINFVNMTHINARLLEIDWDHDDLRYLLAARLRDSTALVREMKLSELSDEEVFERIFPPKVSQGEKQSSTWKWMLSRIQDGNDVIAPRNLIELIENARQAQLAIEKRTSRTTGQGVTLIESEAIKKAHKMLSKTRTTDTLYAENSSLVPTLEKFRDQKAEQTNASIGDLLDITDQNELAKKVQELRDVGFLRPVGKAFKIPVLYREGLNIRQGKANGKGVSRGNGQMSK